MKKYLLMMAVAIIATAGLSSCGGNKGGESNEGSETTEQTSPKSTEIDYAGINALESKGEELTSDDYDFLLDQTEILTNKALDMSKDEYQNFVNNLTEEQMGAIFKLGLGLSTAAKQGKLSAAQLQRYEELKAKDPTK